MKITNMKIFYLLSLMLLSMMQLDAARYPKREMRGVWIATVANIDWPSSATLTPRQQQKELIELLNLSKAYNMNTVVFQIRPAADAFYASRYEPWSQWLTGKQGKKPDPYYDPLAFASNECRKRGLDLHVWINPYRAVFNVNSSSITPDHITLIHPEWFITYGKSKYFNPALPQVRDFVAMVVSDIVRRYDIDAINMDDYFYPYRISGEGFPDDKSFELYPNGYRANQHSEWRRNNVDLIIKQLHDSIKSIKPWVAFGIAPFGVWRNSSKDPAGSKTNAGQTNYDDLFADVLKWQRNQWIDYVAPQVYWEIGKDIADYAVISDWWSRNTYGTQLYIGQALYKIDPEAKEKSWQTSDEIIRQIKLNRKYAGISGSIFYSARFLRTNPSGLQQKLLKRFYKFPALTPQIQRIVPLQAPEPVNVQMTVNNGKLHLSWEKTNHMKSFVIYQFKRRQKVNIKKPNHIFLTTANNSVVYAIDNLTDPNRYKYAVTALSHSNGESNPVEFLETK